MSLRLQPPPIRDNMFSESNVLQKTWVLFFENLFRKMTVVDDEETTTVMARESISIASSREDNFADASLTALLLSSPELTSTKDTTVNDLLTLYWAGV